MQSMASMGSPARTPARESDPAHRAYLDTYELDKRSIFVGNLAADIDEFQLKGAFDKFGRILNVTVHKNESVIDGTSSKLILEYLLIRDSFPKALLCFRRV
jgi:hypothetical protein